MRTPAVHLPRSLESIVAFDALLNSEERYPAPKCHPDTRKVALEIVKSWVWNRAAGFKSIMWVSGAPGVGKTALLQTSCETLAGPNDPIHASFFFARGQGLRELAASLAPTIGYQFTINSIICRWHIWYSLRQDPTILHQTFQSQFRKLVTSPACARSYVQYPMVVVIDGLDECINSQDRVSLLELIFEAASTKSIRFLITSRPEQDIDNFFKHPDVSQHVDHITLDEETFQTSKDIRIFLRSEFARIRQSRPDLDFPTFNGEDWPGDAIIDRATVDSDGQFIFATLFSGFIDEELFSPHEQLQTLLNPPTLVTAFSKLDRLYQQILTRCPRHMDKQGAKFLKYQDTVKGILHVTIAWPHRVHSAEIARVLGEDVHVVQNIVRGPLRTLFEHQGSGPNPTLTFCHKSLVDCLLDPYRSGEYHVPPNALDILYLRILSRPPPADPTQTFSREHLVVLLYSVVAWESYPWKKDMIPLVPGLDNDVASRVISPLADLLLTRDGLRVYIRSPSFKKFLLDPNASGEFHVPPNALDLLYLRILGRPPPLDPSQTFSRDQLLLVIYVVVAWPEPLAEVEIASLIGMGYDTVKNVVAPLRGLIFCLGGTKIIPFHPCQAFFLDPDRSGEFHVPPNALDSIYLRILSRPPPLDPLQTLSREQLLRVLQLVVAWPDPLTEADIASVLGMDSNTISHIVISFMGLLFQRGHFSSVKCPGSFKAFFLDPGRSGEFHFPSKSFEDILLQYLSLPPPLHNEGYFTNQPPTVPEYDDVGYDTLHNSN